MSQSVMLMVLAELPGNKVRLKEGSWIGTFASGERFAVDSALADKLLAYRIQGKPVVKRV
ncbi:hypothetical protein N9937_00530 [bacterium]|nr:hypothetical protein [bacterium]